MLTLQTLLSLPVFLSTSLVAHALAAPDGMIEADKNSDVPQVEYAAALTGGEDCGDQQIKQIREGFTEMNALFASALTPSPDGEPELEFFGRPDRIANLTSLYQSNLQRASEYGKLKGNQTSMPDIHVRCDDPLDMCDEGNKQEGKHVAYNIGNEPHINFCKRFFGLDELDETVDKEAGKDNERFDLMNYYNRATAWARMVMHISNVGQAIVERIVPGAQSNSSSEWVMSISNGPMNTSVLAGVLNQRPDTGGPNNIQTLKYAYGAQRAKLLATLSTQEPYDAINNAENYALYAQARYVIDKKGFFPNLPVMDFGSDMAVLANPQIQDGENKKYACFDVSDVVAKRPGMESIGAPLASSASSMKMQSEWIGQTSFALCCTILSCFALSIFS